MCNAACWLICNANLAVYWSTRPVIFHPFLKVWTWAGGAGGCKMSKHSFGDGGRTAGSWLGSCDGEEGLPSVEAPDTQQSPLWIQRSANSQSHMCNHASWTQIKHTFNFFFLSFFFYLVFPCTLVVMILVWFVWRFSILFNYVLLAVLGSYNDVTPRQFFNVQVQTFQVS